MLGNETVVVRAKLVQLDRKRQSEQHVGAGSRCQMQVRLLGDLAAQRIDHHQPAALALGRPDVAHEVQIGDGGVVAPDDVELGAWPPLPGRCREPPPYVPAQASLRTTPHMAPR